MKNLFEVKNLNMHYPVIDGLMGNIKGYVYALNNVNLEIRENEILGLVGESGSGKSTLGNCILKLITPTSGEVLFKGEDILLKDKKQLKEFRKQAQLIFQNPYMSLNPRMKIYDILKEPFIINGIKDKDEINEKIKNIIRLIGMDEDVLTRYPHEFSGGQRQRIAIARAIILNPEFIVADEPVSALDVSIQAQIVNLILSLKGEIVEIADKEELFNNHKHPYTEALLNAVPVISEDKKTKKIILSGDLPSPQNPPKGCKFHTRCPYVMEKCKTAHPDFYEAMPNHKVRCFLCENSG